ncbi:hypothetical protein PC116_g12431 [Phytophthora cactorum]|uniref:Uncharacterized protein n=1 Tax=Phytophthora cactorum TaxID=29920 RepID=A0A8T1DMZ6_9STRA|nr:hypothetical protein Pcac1_g1985 [Phytophthora cactorum]KAG2923553.1 hypothetical protein PC114_g4782 [Phytophthora cactorum]KAG2942358.1 hypothetical protein PC117_g9818 [Phytophthora cactorum]KAG3031626.1 hypothetical protein PC120_g2986 [Phytophthora cactorum]KAG3185627.1 hypothetical protein PC128_g13272 [Phytophthora cactorum]
MTSSSAAPACHQAGLQLRCAAVVTARRMEHAGSKRVLPSKALANVLFEGNPARNPEPEIEVFDRSALCLRATYPSAALLHRDPL